MCEASRKATVYLWGDRQSSLHVFAAHETARAAKLNKEPLDAVTQNCWGLGHYGFGLVGLGYLGFGIQGFGVWVSNPCGLVGRRISAESGWGVGWSVWFKGLGGRV